MQSLEEKAKETLRRMSKDVFAGPRSMEECEFLEKNRYIEVIGGTPKSGARYKVMDAGMAYAGIQ